MKRHSGAELERFLVAVDDALTERVPVIVIGGSALILGYGVFAATSDIDTLSTQQDLVQQAARRARQATGLEIPIAASTIAQFPDGFEDRLVRVVPQLTKLEVWVPEVHDLAASKLLRGNEHDRQQLSALHQENELDRDTLVERFQSLLRDYVGDPTEPRWSLFHFVTEIWGELAGLDLHDRV